MPAESLISERLPRPRGRPETARRDPRAAGLGGRRRADRVPDAGGARAPEAADSRPREQGDVEQRGQQPEVRAQGRAPDGDAGRGAGPLGLHPRRRQRDPRAVGRGRPDPLRGDRARDQHHARSRRRHRLPLRRDVPEHDPAGGRAEDHRRATRPADRLPEHPLVQEDLLGHQGRARRWRGSSHSTASSASGRSTIRSAARTSSTAIARCTGSSRPPRPVCARSRT